MPPRSSSRATAEEEPLRLWVGGEAGAGKSALIAALAGDDASDNSLTSTSGGRRFAITEAADAHPIAADVALIVVDARRGFDAAARRQAAVARTVGAQHLVLAIDKLEKLGWDHSAYDAAAAALADFGGKFQFASATAIPVSALQGDNIHAPSASTPWYSGPALNAHLDALTVEAPPTQSAHAPQLTEQFAAHLAWMAPTPLLPGREYKLTLGNQVVTASVTAVKYRLDVASLHREPARTLERGEIGTVSIATAAPVAVDDASELPVTARFVLSDLYTDAVIGAGTVDFALRRGLNIHLQPLAVSKQLRASLKLQRPCIVLFTGLSGAGKSTIANIVEHELACDGCHTYMLDGDNIRHGLNKDLGFTPADRVENIRRVGEVARLFVDAGMIVLCSFISPFRAERAAIRSLVEPAEYIEVYVKAPLEVCEQRDPKGLYAKCRAGLLPNFTGIDSPYEVPEAPDLVLDTTTASAEELARRVASLLHARGMITPPQSPLTAVRGG